MNYIGPPVGEQNCIHGMVHGAGRTEDIPNNIEVLLAVGSVSSVQS